MIYDAENLRDHLEVIKHNLKESIITRMQSYKNYTGQKILDISESEVKIDTDSNKCFVTGIKLEGFKDNKHTITLIGDFEDTGKEQIPLSDITCADNLSFIHEAISANSNAY